MPNDGANGELHLLGSRRQARWAQHQSHQFLKALQGEGDQPDSTAEQSSVSDHLRSSLSQVRCPVSTQNIRRPDGVYLTVPVPVLSGAICRCDHPMVLMRRTQDAPKGSRGVKRWCWATSQKSLKKASLVPAKVLQPGILLAAPGIATRSILTTNVTRMLLGTKGIATRSKDATNGAPGRTTRSKDATRSKECYSSQLV